MQRPPSSVLVVRAAPGAAAGGAGQKVGLHACFLVRLRNLLYAAACCLD